jgi:ferredoxin
MSASPTETRLREAVLEADELDRLIGALRAAGYDVIGPVVRDGVIVLEPVKHAAELPAGWIDEQDPGRYRLVREGSRIFGHTVGFSSWKRFLHPPRVRLWTARADSRSFAITDGADPARPLALLGVRPCDLAAIAILDRVLLGGPWADPVYRERREQAFLVGVQCSRAARTCFCASVGTGPRAASGFDLALTEVQEDGRHYFVLESGTPRGAQLLTGLDARSAGEGEHEAALRATEQAATQITRELDHRGLAARLRGNPEHPHWEKVAARCLACGNCTQVCPTCFCTSMTDVAALGGGEVSRIRRWDSCFSQDFSYIHGGGVRTSVRARWRHWATHKHGTWHEQFGGSGCTGCGRCITWCPAGIDITEETAAIRAGSRKGEASHADA